MESYTLSLALEDFLPVIFSSFGLWFIVQMIRGVSSSLGNMALMGWGFITTGGLLQAIWKLTMALSNSTIDVVVLNKGLFVWLGTGFLLLCYAVSYARRVVDNRKPRRYIWLWPLIVISLHFAGALMTGFPDPTISTWRFIFLGLLTISNVVLVGLLIRLARRQNQTLVAILFAINIILVITLSGLARIPDQSIPLQWVEQLLNTAAQIAFCYAAWQLYLKNQLLNRRES